MGTTPARPAGTLFIVATPIGNLEDVTMRALRVLREVAVIAAEDTRRTAHLLAKYGISTPTISFHQHNAHGRTPKLVERLQGGDSVALVSDAGTPGLSDPGLELVQACVGLEIAVDSIPGPSAPLAAVVASGFPVIPLTILGFTPTKAKDRKRWLEQLSTLQTTVTFFESPHRVAQSLREMASLLGDRPIMVARELTKLHQEFLRGTAGILAEQLSATRGEITVVVSPPEDQGKPKELLSDAEIADFFCQIPDNDPLSRGERIALTARRLGIPRRSVFAALERTKVSVE